jgi:hypothetical protein
LTAPKLAFRSFGRGAAGMTVIEDLLLRNAAASFLPLRQLRLNPLTLALVETSI